MFGGYRCPNNALIKKKNGTRKWRTQKKNGKIAKLYVTHYVVHSLGNGADFGYKFFEHISCLGLALAHFFTSNFTGLVYWLAGAVCLYEWLTITLCTYAGV